MQNMDTYIETPKSQSTWKNPQWLAFKWIVDPEISLQRKRTGK